MKILRSLSFIVFLLLSLSIASCSSSSRINKEIVGKYAPESENNYDHFKDTIEIRSTNDGKFDIQTIAKWSAAKKDDPERPNKNKKVGVWNNYGAGDIEDARSWSSGSFYVLMIQERSYCNKMTSDVLSLKCKAYV